MKKLLILLVLILSISCNSEISKERYEKLNVHLSVCIIRDLDTGYEYLVYPKCFSVVLFGRVIARLNPSVAP